MVTHTSVMRSDGEARHGTLAANARVCRSRVGIACTCAYVGAVGSGLELDAPVFAMAATGSQARGSGAARQHRCAVSDGRGDDDSDSDDDDNLVSDDSDYVSSGSAEPMPAGPETYEETLETMRYIVGRIFEVMGSAMDEPWGEVAEKGVVFTTDYSGSGTAELAMAFLEERPPSLCIACAVVCG
jgi:hypothetical protein